MSTAESSTQSFPNISMIDSFGLIIDAHGKEFSVCFDCRGVFEGVFSCSIDTNPVSYGIFHLNGELGKLTPRFYSTRFSNLCPV